LNNVRLLADNYAEAGFFSYIPDLLDGDPLPLDFLQSVEPPLKVQENLGVIQKTKNTAIVGITLPPWLMKHRESVTKPLLDKFIESVREIPGTKKIGALGFCWGGRYAILEAHPSQGTGGVDAAFACHPSLVSIPGDFEPVTKPLGIAVGDRDSLLNTASIQKITDILKKKDVPQEVKVYPDQIHGFALRGDWSSEKDKQAMDESEQQSIKWFNTYLA
jgi:dienelactone hydrolase